MAQLGHVLTNLSKVPQRAIKFDLATFANLLLRNGQSLADQEERGVADHPRVAVAGLRMNESRGNSPLGAELPGV